MLWYLIHARIFIDPLWSNTYVYLYLMLYCIPDDLVDWYFLFFCTYLVFGGCYTIQALQRSIPSWLNVGEITSQK